MLLLSVFVLSLPPVPAARSFCEFDESSSDTPAEYITHGSVLCVGSLKHVRTNSFGGFTKQFRKLLLIFTALFLYVVGGFHLRRH